MPGPSKVDVAKASLIAYNNKDWDALPGILTSDIVYDEVASGRKATGHAEVLPVWRAWAEALPDSKATIHGTFESGDNVVIELTWNGTHTGPLQTPKGPIPPTGKKVSLRSCQVITLSGGKTRSIRQYFDMATLMGQLGLLPGA